MGGITPFQVQHGVRCRSMKDAYANFEHPGTTTGPALIAEAAGEGGALVVPGVGRPVAGVAPPLAICRYERRRRREWRRRRR